MLQTVEKYESGFPKVMNRGKYDLEVNKRMKEVRNRRGYSLAKVKNLLAVRGIKTGVSTVQGYEAEEDNINHRYPSLNMLLNLCNLYDCSMDYLFGITDEMNRPSNDLRHSITTNDEVFWNGVKMTSGQKALLLEKADEIMAL